MARPQSNGGKKYLDDDLSFRLDPSTIFCTSNGKKKIENTLFLTLLNKKRVEPLLNNGWDEIPPRIDVCFAYGDGKGALTTNGNTLKDLYSARNIKFEVSGQSAKYKWEVREPNKEEEGWQKSPYWILQPLFENRNVLGFQSEAWVTFKITNIATKNPPGNTQLYLQYSNFPGYYDGYMTLDLSLKNFPPELCLIKGSILMWSGEIDNDGHPVVDGEPDTRWHICDGNNGTPDLRDRFIIGGGDKYTVGAKGGSDSQTLTINSMPKHTHSYGGDTMSSGGHVHKYTNYDQTWDYTKSTLSKSNFKAWGPKADADTESKGDHFHTFSGTTGFAGEDEAFSIIPPYYALAYIMYVQH